MSEVGTFLWILLFGLALAYGIFWVLILREIAARPRDVYKRAGESKVIWFLVVLVLQLFGTLAYFLFVRNELSQAEKSGAESAS
jgi:Phospholipase_D-nuclease N-terminal